MNATQNALNYKAGVSFSDGMFQDLSNFLFLAEGRLQDPLDKLARRLRNGELKQLESEHNALVAVAEAAKIVRGLGLQPRLSATELSAMQDLSTAIANLPPRLN